MAENVDDPNKSFEAQQAAEAVDAGEEKTANVDVESDYEASKKLSVSPVDQAEEGQKSGQS